MDAPFAFLVVTHLAPDSVSLLPELLRRRARVTVVEIGIDDPVSPSAGHVYLAPPGRTLVVEGGLVKVTHVSAPRRPISQMFKSLGVAAGSRAAGIVLSGSGSDGNDGLVDLAAAGGLALAQDPLTAGYTGMPDAAIATGVVVQIAAPKDFPAMLMQWSGGEAFVESDAALSVILPSLLNLVYDRTGTDFRGYKQTTVRRRVHRRMAARDVRDAPAYLELCKREPTELHRLRADMLIGVTSFFRDVTAYTCLAEVGLPLLLDSRPPGTPVRVWVPACSTGEEAYTLSILLDEYMRANSKRLELQIFATDIDATAIERARRGWFPPLIGEHLTPERLERYFTQRDGGYVARRSIRQSIVFAVQDLISDPPFTRIDLLSCRNLLIYLDRPLQQRVFPILRYALRPGGLLMLGNSESLGADEEFFTAVDKASRLFRRKLSDTGSVRTYLSSRRVQHPASRPEMSVPPRLSTTIESVLLDECVPPAVVIDEQGEVIHIHGRIGRFLEPAPGTPRFNVFEMARPGLEATLRAGVREAQSSDQMVTLRAIVEGGDGELETIEVLTRRLNHPEPLMGAVLILFELIPVVSDADADAVDVDRARQLEDELKFARRSQQSVLEELQGANEELKSMNEELQSTNEELQSTNEELETAREEAQSLNEELGMVNDELSEKVRALTRVGDDMRNLLEASGIATVFLARDLSISRFTEGATNVLPLLETDVGRPLSDLVSGLTHETLAEQAADVMRTLQPIEREVKSIDGTWYWMQIRPYRTIDDVIDGLVMTFVDVSVLRGAAQGVTLPLVSDAVASVVGERLLVVDDEMRVVAASAAARSLIAHPDIDRVEVGDLPMQSAAFMDLVRQAASSAALEAQGEIGVGSPEQPVQVSVRAIQYPGHWFAFAVFH